MRGRPRALRRLPPSATTPVRPPRSPDRGPAVNPPLIAPSILAADFARLGEEVRGVLEAGADVVHFDVMDNHFVPNLSFGPLVCAALRAHRRHRTDRRAPDGAAGGPADRGLRAGRREPGFSFHPEASGDPGRSIALIREHGCRAGLALGPDSSLALLDPVLDGLIWSS